jgi:hypothetical protein
MNLIKGFAVTFGAVAVMAAAVACSDEKPEPPTDAPVVQSISPGAAQSVAPVSSGSMIPRPVSAEGLVAQSRIIVVGTLDQDFEEIMIGGYGPDGKASTDPEGAMAYTDYKVNIEEIIKGADTVSAGKESFVFRMFGHINVQKAVPTSVLFKLPDPGDRLLFALGRNPDGTYGSGPEGLIDIESEVGRYEDGRPFASGVTTAELLAQIRAAISK